MHALLTDAYFGGYQGYHMNGFNVLFGDMHAKWISDPDRIIIDCTGGGSKYNLEEPNERGWAFMVWDFFSRNP